MRIGEKERLRALSGTHPGVNHRMRFQGPTSGLRGSARHCAATVINNDTRLNSVGQGLRLGLLAIDYAIIPYSGFFPHFRVPDKVSNHQEPTPRAIPIGKLGILSVPIAVTLTYVYIHYQTLIKYPQQ